MTELSTVEIAGQPRAVRAARALVGWMTANDAALIQLGKRKDKHVPAAIETRAQAARTAVAARVVGVDQADAISDIPPTLEDHVATLQQHPAAERYFADGWQVRLADLSRVCAIQPSVFIDQAAQRVQAVNPHDIAEIAAVSLPVPPDVGLPAQFDSTRNVWMLSSPNPNLRIVGTFNKAVKPGIAAFGFAVAISPSFVQVVRFQGRLFLRDGYHRAVGFLQRGIRVVPVFYRELGQLEGLAMGAGILPDGAYLGERPPMLPDFLNDDVAVSVQLPATQKMIVIHGLEVSPLG